MIYLVFLIGVICGSIVTKIIENSHKSFGEFRVDPRENTCSVCLNTEDVIKSNKKRIVLTVDHNADLSQK